MRKIINGKMYNTETAKIMGKYSASCSYSDFHYYSEELYRKKTGEYFLYGNGNAASKYNRRCGTNEWCGGEDIVPMTEDEAKVWAENHLDVDNYINIFGEVEE